MIESFDKQFYEKFQFGDLTIDYFNSNLPKELAVSLSQGIVQKLKPKFVLDVGCVAGYLVCELRKSGVEAFGVDVSDYAISKVSSRAASFCFVCSLLDRFPSQLPKKFDVVVCNGLFDYLKPYEVKAAVDRLCELSENVLIGSYLKNVDDFTKDNLNYLSGLFAQHEMFKSDFCFFKNEFCTLTLFSAKISNFEAVEIYENRLFNLNVDVLKLKRENECLNEKILNYSKDLATYKEIGESYYELKKEREDHLIELNILRASYEKFIAITESSFWKLTKPFRACVDFLKRAVKFALRIVFRKKYGANLVEEVDSDSVNYFKKTQPTEKFLEWQRNFKFKNNYLVSIVVPVYNVPMNFLQELIYSVMNQTYKFWELCLADGSDVFSYKMRVMCEDMAKQNPRIKYLKLEKNLGIAQNTNAALSMATGDYVALLDHDDLLSPTALFECMKVVEQQGADFVYTDELTFENSINNVKFIHFKPDFSPDSLRANNYICHLSLFSAKLMRDVGGFSNEYDGSQDYDMILKLTEKAEKIVHIPKVLYYWREHSASVAQNLMNKPYCLEAAKKALSAHIRRVGLKGKVSDSRYPSTYKVDYFVAVKSLVSIIVVNKNYVANLKKCVDSVLNGSSYKNFEIVIVDCKSNSQTCDFYKVLQNQDKRVRTVFFDEPGDFNYSRAVNFGVSQAKGDFYVLLHSDTKVITTNWLECMLMFAQRSDVGAVGAKLLSVDDTVQGGGYFLSGKHVALPAFNLLLRNEGGYVCRASLVQNLSAVSSVCMMIRRNVWECVGGFNESLALNFNDVDFCLKLRSQNFLIIYNSYVEIYHSRMQFKLQKAQRSQRVVQFENEKNYMLSKWSEVLQKGDPYYNPNLNDDFCDFSIKKVKSKILEISED